jgi:hypothetical protein
VAIELGYGDKPENKAVLEKLARQLQASWKGARP